MARILAIVLFTAAVCSVNSGCCCCRIPFVAQGPIVQPPPIVVNQPPIVNPPVIPPNDKDKKNFGGKKTYRYDRWTGQLTLEGQPIGTGFSGVGKARNNPWMQEQLKTGVIPGGDWRITGRRMDPKTGTPVFDLQFFTGGHVKGRIPGETFTIHADSIPGAGESGIALPRQTLDAIQIEEPLTTILVFYQDKDLQRPKDFKPPKDLNPAKDKDKVFAPPGDSRVYVYRQSTGELKLGDEVLGKGWSGEGKARNNPAMQKLKNTGPIPVGEYVIINKAPFASQPGGEPTILLQPPPAAQIWGRGLPLESFAITHDTGNAPNTNGGNIVMPRAVRDRIEFRANPPPNRLKVVP